MMNASNQLSQDTPRLATYSISNNVASKCCSDDIVTFYGQNHQKDVSERIPIKQCKFSTKQEENEAFDLHLQSSNKNFQRQLEEDQKEGDRKQSQERSLVRKDSIEVLGEHRQNSENEKKNSEVLPQSLIDCLCQEKHRKSVESKQIKDKITEKMSVFERKISTIVKLSDGKSKGCLDSQLNFNKQQQLFNMDVQNPQSLQSHKLSLRNTDIAQRKTEKSMLEFENQFLKERNEALQRENSFLNKLTTHQQNSDNTVELHRKYQECLIQLREKNKLIESFQATILSLELEKHQKCSQRPQSFTEIVEEFQSLKRNAQAFHEYIFDLEQENTKLKQNHRNTFERLRKAMESQFQDRKVKEVAMFRVQFEQKCSDLQSQISQLQSENQKIRGWCQETRAKKQSENQRLNLKLTEAENALLVKQKQIGQMIAKLSSLRGELTFKQESLLRVQSEKQTLIKTIQDSENRQKDLKKQIEFMSQSPNPIGKQNHKRNSLIQQLEISTEGNIHSREDILSAQNAPTRNQQYCGRKVKSNNEELEVSFLRQRQIEVKNKQNALLIRERQLLEKQQQIFRVELKVESELRKIDLRETALKKQQEELLIKYQEVKRRENSIAMDNFKYDIKARERGWADKRMPFQSQQLQMQSPQQPPRLSCQNVESQQADFPRKGQYGLRNVNLQIKNSHTPMAPKDSKQRLGRHQNLLQGRAGYSAGNQADSFKYRASGTDLNNCIENYGAEKERSRSNSREAERILSKLKGQGELRAPIICRCAHKASCTCSSTGRGRDISPRKENSTRQLGPNAEISSAYLVGARQRKGISEKMKTPQDDRDNKMRKIEEKIRKIRSQSGYSSKK